MVLGKEAHCGLMPPDHLAFVEEYSIVAAGFAQFGVRDRRRTRQQSIYQSCFARTVASHEDDFLSSRDAGGEVAYYRNVAVRLAHVFHFQDVLSRGTLLLEFEIGALDVRLCQFGHLQPLYFLAAG